jgi:hypothetical protein
MKTATKDGVTSVVAQHEVIIPDLTVNDLLSAIPSVVPILFSMALQLTATVASEHIVFSVRRFALRFTCK